MSSEKCNLEQQGDTTVHLLEWSNLGTPTTPNDGENVEQWELSFISGGNAKLYSHLKKIKSQVKYYISDNLQSYGKLP